MVNRVLHLGTSWGGVSAAKFDGSKKSAQVTLSGGDLIATTTGSAGEGRTTFVTGSHSTGKYHIEATLTTSAGATGGCGFGFANSTLAPDDGHFLGETGSGAFGMYDDGSLYGDPIGGTTNFATTFDDGTTVVWEINLDTKHAWVKWGSQDWNHNPSADPATDTGGRDISNLGDVPLWAVVEGETTGDIWTLNAGSSAYAFTPTAGFGNW